LKNFPFKILFLCIFLPPVCYILTLNGLEKYLGSRETERVQDFMIQDQQALYEGRHTIKEEINRNIGRYLSGDFKHKIGIKTEILVKTRDERILYPSQTRLDTASAFREEGGFAETGLESLRYTEVASENYRTLNEGLVLDVNLQIGQNTWLANSILIAYIFLSLAVLQAFIRRGIRQTEREEDEQKALIRKLSEQLDQAEEKLNEVEAREGEYVERIATLRIDPGCGRAPRRTGKPGVRTEGAAPDQGRDGRAGGSAQRGNGSPDPAIQEDQENGGGHEKALRSAVPESPVHGSSAGGFSCTHR
jgi:hypothetical protein